MASSRCPNKHVTVVKGDEAKVAFQLKPIPAISMLRVTGGIPGTQVVVDGKPLGTTGQDGSLPASQLPPGSHTVILRKDTYKPKTFELNFAAGKDVTLTGADVVLEALFGTLNVAVNPAGAQLTIQRSGETQSRPLAGNSVHLAEGSYTITATAPHFRQQSTSVEIATGGTKNVTLQLAPERVAPQPKPVTHVSMSGWQFPAAWTPEGDLATRECAATWCSTARSARTYSFVATMKHGSHLRWVAHLVNEKNFAEFELDGENYYRRLVIDGKTKEIGRKPLRLSSPVSAAVQLTISAAGIVQKIQQFER